MATGFCECGCGGMTTIARQSDTRLGYVKGQPVRFILGHSQKSASGRLGASERAKRRVRSSRQRCRQVAVVRDGAKRNVLQHIVIALTALRGRPMPAGADVHHVDGNPRNNARRNLVICQSKGYHRLLHVRTRVLAAGGDPSRHRICGACERPKPFDAFCRASANKSGGVQRRCKDCHRTNRRKAA